jgi:hypothetical protein
MRKQIFIAFVTCVSACALLTGCHINHEWTEATCTEPKTCSVGGETEGEALGHEWAEATCTEPKTCSRCGETEGEALGHDWAEATCTEPKTCSRCGETEGDALGHDWIEANYQQPKTCNVCGETEGDVLTPAFEEHGLSINVKLGETYDCVTMCNENTSKKTTGKAVFSDYQVLSELEGYDTPEGYEWRTVHVSILFDDDNAWNYGISIGFANENYYDIQGWDDSRYDDEDSGLSIYTVNYNGIDYDKCAHTLTGGFGDWVDQTITFEATVIYRVPIGYDGAVFGLRDKSIEWEDGMYIYDVADENTLFFRFE